MEKHNWQKVTYSKTSTEPSPRWGHAAVSARHEMIVFGGYAGIKITIKIRSIWMICGASTLNKWHGSNTKPQGRSPLQGQIVRSISSPQVIALFCLVEEDHTNSDIIKSMFSTGRPSNGHYFPPKRMKIVRGRERIIHLSYTTPTYSCSEDRGYPILTTFGHSTSKLKNGLQSQIVWLHASRVLADFTLRLWLIRPST